MGRKKQVHIYLDNCAWGHLHDKIPYSVTVKGKKIDFQATDKHSKAIENGPYNPVLSEYNYAEACKRLISNSEQVRKEGKDFLSFMMKLADPCLFREKDLYRFDYSKVMGYKTRSYFLPRKQLSNLLDTFRNPGNKKNKKKKNRCVFAPLRFAPLRKNAQFTAKQKFNQSRNVSTYRL